MNISETAAGMFDGEWQDVSGATLVSPLVADATESAVLVPARCARSSNAWQSVAAIAAKGPIRSATARTKVASADSLREVMSAPLTKVE